MIYHFVPRIIGPLLYSFEKSHKVQFRILQGEDTPNLNLNINKSNILGFYSKYFKYKINSHEIYQKLLTQPIKLMSTMSTGKVSKGKGFLIDICIISLLLMRWNSTKKSLATRK